MAVAVTSTGDTDRAAVVATALDYFEGWFDGDAVRMERALHPGLAKRSLGQVASAGAELRGVTKDEMVTATAEGKGKAKDPGPSRRIDVTVVDSDVYREYLHLVRTNDGWKIVNALWHST